MRDLHWLESLPTICSTILVHLLLKIGIGQEHDRIAATAHDTSYMPKGELDVHE